ncbi:hypothetical protein C6I20_10895 [Aeromicrobium sp. A1-2]|uniref:hypothetical protein n=1 Tax=Aeromicrobium sp. A1-2 TaxID=2107713 RepID=UPI000E528E79|nr:hypothetical protein [Aeromicrobium sp. A1-2]AXT85648.1 hypothetical protein C6I20_10895 [Aeromicrobium sp. A1-2]
MTTDLNSLIAHPPSGRRTAVILDAHDWAQCVVLQGKDVPWRDTMAYANFVSQAQGLLDPDATLVALDRWYDHRVASDEGLRASMAAKTRTGYALRTLLADPESNRQVLELVTIFTQTQRRPVILHIPSPRRWLERTHAFSGAATTDALDSDDAENASMYVADWLRGFASLPIAAVMLDDRDRDRDRDRGSGAGGSPVALSVYTPLANATSNYGWSLAMRSDDAVQVWGSDVAGALIPEGFWSASGAATPAGDFLLGAVPEAAVPEIVRSRIGEMV